MDELEWLASNDPAVMLTWLQNGQPGHRPPRPPQPPLNPRKMRLFACACARHVWHLLTDPASRRAVEAAEAFADGGDMALMRQAYGKAPVDSPVGYHYYGWQDLAWLAASAIRDSSIGEWFGSDHINLLDADFAALLREIAGNPFRLVTLPRERILIPIGPFEIDAGTVDEGWGEEFCPWLTPTVLDLANAAYDGRVAAPCGLCVDGDMGCSRCEGAGYYYDPPTSLNRLKCPYCNHGLLPGKCKRCGGAGRLPGVLVCDPDRLAILADALGDAGCPDTVTVERPVRVLIWGNPDGWHVTFCNTPYLRPFFTNPRRLECARWAEKAYRVKSWTKLRKTWSGEGFLTETVPHPLLAHLRSRGPHVRGCHALDALLGKT